jgi:hypothetical protein
LILPDARVATLSPTDFKTRLPLRQNLRDDPPLAARWLTLPAAAPLAGQSQCTLLAPSTPKIGATSVGIGGVGHVDLWLNGARLHSGALGGKIAARLHTRVALPEPLSADDALSVIVCAPTAERPAAIALSFWN